MGWRARRPFLYTQTPDHPGSEVVLGTAAGNVRTRDVRRVPEAECWDKALMDSCMVSFKRYLVPAAAAEEAFDFPLIRPDPKNQLRFLESTLAAVRVE